MTNLLLLVLLLVLLAGVIAFAGDRLGTFAGRKRLSLFGMRPKRTGMIVGVLAGILIMLTTLAVLAIAFENATRTLLNAQRTADELTRLQARQRVLEADITGLEQELAEASETIASANAQRDEAQRAVAAAREQLAELELERDALDAETEMLRRDVEAAREDLAGVQAQRDTALGRLEEVRGQLEQAGRELELAEAEAAAARADADAARAETQRLQEEVALAQADLEAARAQLAALQNDLSATEIQLSEAEAAVQDALAARDAALAARDVALEERDAALAEVEEARAERMRAEEERDAAREDAARARDESEQLQVQIRALQADAETLREQARQLESTNRALEARATEISNENRGLQSQNAALQELRDRLQRDVLAANASVEELEAQLARQQQRLEEQSRELERAVQQFNEVAGGQVTYKRNELIYSGLVSANSVAEAQEAVAAFARAASDHTLRRGAGDVVLSTEQFNGLVQAVAESDRPLLVVLTSPRNQFSGLPVEASFDAVENTKLFDRGQLIVSRRIHLGDEELRVSREELRETLRQVVEDTNRRLTIAGLFATDGPSFPNLSEEGFTNQLLRMRGPVTIGVVAGDDIYRGGPAPLEFLILY